MKPTELASALKEALGEPLANFTTALKANTDATQALLNKQDDTQGDEQEQSPATVVTEPDSSNEKLNTLETKFSNVETKLDKLTAAFAKAAGIPADDTTVGEEEHQGDDTKYNNLL